ncbi:hypothetical protein M378DRAFT_547002 [Amanita muscaria Koide BX008]|uniref:Uncharacterized protein n=1 Tax=Amanita muscaria (strain Koide BX008) TaxID=946122 RepID=A0A0C2TEE7_AMAMK|nr:hypothetical protein M378DRAFT_547002 [Amanita muscaria Koide BX008]
MDGVLLGDGTYRTAIRGRSEDKIDQHKNKAYGYCDVEDALQFKGQGSTRTMVVHLACIFVRVPISTPLEC